MELNIFNINLNVDHKNREEISEFIKQLSDYIENNDERQISMLEEVQNSEKITVLYRDKMYIERNKILNEYAKKSQENEVLYYIYDKVENTNTFCLNICKEDNSNIVIELEQDELPQKVTVDTVLRQKEGQYIIDRRATFIVRKQIEEMVNKLIGEQEKYLQSNRIEGHTYEVGEVESDRAWLYDITKNEEDGIEAFEEINFPLELLNKVTEGSKVIYQNGTYEIKI